MSQKINTIVFSKDNAAQLSLFLESVKKNASEVFNLNVFIEYTEDNYQKGYEIISTDNKYSDVNFIYPEVHNALYPDYFKKSVLDIIKEKCDYFTFFLDDNIIYNEIKLDDIINQIESDDDIVCFSLRLGENTKNCYTLGAENVLSNIEDCGDFMKWDWTLHYLDFGYPFSTEGHVFRRKDIYKLSKKCRFVNAEELEASLFDYTETFPRNKMVSYKESALVGAPAGRVQQSIEDTMELAYKRSEAKVRRRMMNTLFVEGNFPTLESIDFSNIEGCHQKLDFGELGVETSALDKVAIKKFGKRWDETTEEEKYEIDDIFDKFEQIVKSKEDGE